MTEVVIANQQQRRLSLRYDRYYTQENNEWGDFQVHRKVLGLVCFAKCNNENEINELKKLYEGVKQQYNGTIFDSRLVIFGVDQKDGNKTGGGEEEGASCDTSPTNEDKENLNVPNQNASSSGQKPALTNGGGGGRGNNEQSKDGNILFYTDIDQCQDLEDRMKDFAASLFWVLEGKRLDRSHERLDKMPLLTTPFEKRDIIGVDTDSR